MHTAWTPLWAPIHLSQGASLPGTELQGNIFHLLNEEHDPGSWITVCLQEGEGQAASVGKTSPINLYYKNLPRTKTWCPDSGGGLLWACTGTEETWLFHISECHLSLCAAMASAAPQLTSHSMIKVESFFSKNMSKTRGAISTFLFNIVLAVLATAISQGNSLLLTPAIISNWCFPFTFLLKHHLNYLKGLMLIWTSVCPNPLGPSEQ